MLDLLLVGNITRDRIVSAEEERTTTGGAVFYGSFAAAAHGIRVGVLTRLAPADRALLRELEEAGIEVTAVDSARTTEIQNIAKSADFERRRFVVNAAAEPFTLGDLESIEARTVLICPLMKGEFPLDGIEKLAYRCRVALDVQGFIRCLDGDTLRSSDWPEKREGLRHVTTLKTDRRETQILTGIDDMAEAARELAAMGPREVLVTHTEGIHLHADGRSFDASFHTGTVRGRTGRGDTAVAAYLAKRFTAGPEAALQWTAALVSRKLEQPGPFKGPLDLKNE